MSGLTQLMTDICDAVRERDGTTASIPALTIPARVLGIPSGGITPLVQSLTFSGAHATSAFIRVADSRAFYAENGLVAIVCRGGTNTSYENLYYTLAAGAPAGVTLVGQSSYRYASESAGQYYIAILSGITAPVNINGLMNTQNSSSDYTQISLQVTLA